MHIVETVVRLFLLLAILELVRRGKLRQRYSLLFLLIGMLLLLLPLLEIILENVPATVLGIKIGPSFLVSTAFVALFVVQVAQAVIISSLSIQTRDLAQKVAELEWQLDQLREHVRSVAEELAEGTSVPDSIVQDFLLIGEID
jgi:hypothetical protein